MLRLDLDRQLGQLQQEVVSLAEIVDKATMRAVDALKTTLRRSLRCGGFRHAPGPGRKNNPTGHSLPQRTSNLRAGPWRRVVTESVQIDDLWGLPC